MTSLTTHHQFFGPTPGAGFTFTPTIAWKALTAFSGSTKEIYWAFGTPPILFAQWLVIWRPINISHKVELSSFGDANNPTPISELVATPNGNPIVQGANVTTQMRALRDAQQARQLLTRYCGDGEVAATLYENRLTIVWDI